MPQSRAAKLAYYGLPMLFCLAVHWIAIKTWFYADDFAWMGLRFEIHSPHDLLHVLFTPRAQGTVRTLGERVYFLAFSSLFGLHAWPLRLWAFLTQFANIALLMGVTRRIAGSAMAGFVAGILWAANSALAIPMHWSSAYNELCCAFFMLLAFYFLLRYIETNDSKFWLWQWLVFLLGFGALELNVMYPALAASYALCCARPYFRKTLYLFIPSLGFTLLHYFYVPKVPGPVYALHFDAGIVSNFWRHFSYAVAASRPDRIDWRPVWLGLAFSIAVAAVLVSYALVRAKRQDSRGLFFLGWFVLVLLPVLPLTNHSSEYYSAIPAIGLAMLAAWGLSSSRSVAAYALAGVYLVLSITDIRIVDRFFYTQAHAVKRLVQGLESTSQEHAGKMILLDGVNNDLFAFGVWDDPFRLIGIRDIHLTPGSEKLITAHREPGDSQKFFVTRQAAVAALNKNQAVVYSVNPGGIQNVTSAYRAMARAEQVSQNRDTVDVGDPMYADRLGPGWFGIEGGTRWMSKSASVQLGGPSKPGQRLFVKGFCPEVILKKGPIHLTLSADGSKLGSATLNQPESFALQFPLPPALVGKYAITITVEVDRTLDMKNEARQLGLVFGTFSVR